MLRFRFFFKAMYFFFNFFLNISWGLQPKVITFISKSCFKQINTVQGAVFDRLLQTDVTVDGPQRQCMAIVASFVC